MKRFIYTMAAIASFCLGSSSIYTQVLVQDGSYVGPNRRVYGSTAWYSSYTRITVNGVVIRQFTGSQTYEWDRTNTEDKTFLGYTVTISALDYEPDSGLYSHFGDAVVNWGPEVLPPPPGGGGGE